MLTVIIVNLTQSMLVMCICIYIYIYIYECLFLIFQLYADIPSCESHSTVCNLTLTRMELLISRIAEWLYFSSTFAIDYLQASLHVLITEYSNYTYRRLLLFLNIKL